MVEGPRSGPVSPRWPYSVARNKASIEPPASGGSRYLGHMGHLGHSADVGTQVFSGERTERLQPALPISGNTQLPISLS